MAGAAADGLARLGVGRRILDVVLEHELAVRQEYVFEGPRDAVARHAIHHLDVAISLAHVREAECGRPGQPAAQRGIAAETMAARAGLGLGPRDDVICGERATKIGECALDGQAKVARRGAEGRS